MLYTIQLLPHQIEAMKQTEGKNKVAYYLDMGLGKTYIGSEKAIALNKNILVICQKSKVNDWVEHFEKFYAWKLSGEICNLTDESELKDFLRTDEIDSLTREVGIINYDLVWRRKELSTLTDFTLMLDESSLIQNETAKRSKFILNKLHPSNVIMLSGTPINGKYEQLWSQAHLLGWDIPKSLFYAQYVVYERSNEGYPIITGYKNVERLKRKFRAYGAVFMKTEDVLTLPAQNFIDIKCDETKEFKQFKKDRIITIEDKTLVGDTTLTNMLYQRMLCGQYNINKLEAFEDLIQSTNDRLVVFYNFNDELDKLSKISIKNGRKLSFMNGSNKNLDNFEQCENAVILVQYQSGAYGLNLQKANKIIYFSPPLSSEQFEQSKKRIHRIGQEKPCFYYQLKSGIDYRIYKALEQKRDYTDDLFREEEKQ